MCRRCFRLFAFCVIVLVSRYAIAQSWSLAGSRPGNQMLEDYFEHETDRLTNQWNRGLIDLETWHSRRPELERQLLDMLGLWPIPERTELDTQITGTIEHDEFVVENLYFQSRPGLYVTGNLYRPKEVDEPLPAILYVCGHGGVKVDDVSYGNKVHYHHHGAWFARNGYVCLTIDTLQLGEIEGIHHGTYRYDMWWWVNRGYTPAGVEAWNCVRAIDYLQSRSEVDGERIGVTGRSGGGAYSWWIAAIDQRIKCAVPVAGITDLENHVVDGCVEGHCDCMFFVNTYQWDYPQIAAMVAPRPLLISNTDRDRIFPLDGVARTYDKARQIYQLYNAMDQLAIQITAGPHQDTQELRIHAFRWFNHFLKDDDSLIETAAHRFFEPEQLQVFRDPNGTAPQQLPNDSRNADIHETFVSQSIPNSDQLDSQSWEEFREGSRRFLLDQTFRAWPDLTGATELTLAFDIARDKYRVRAFDYATQPHIGLRMYVIQANHASRASQAKVVVASSNEWNLFQRAAGASFDDAFRKFDRTDSDADLINRLVPTLESVANEVDSLDSTAIVVVCPRGIGPTAWDANEHKQNQIRRRFYLLGQTLAGMQIFDIVRSVTQVPHIPGLESATIELQGSGKAAMQVAMASLFLDNVESATLSDPPTSFRDSPALLNITKRLEIEHVLLMCAEKMPLSITMTHAPDWTILDRLGPELGLQVEMTIVAESR